MASRKYNLKKAQQLVEKVKAANGGTFDVTLLTTTDSDNAAEGQLLIEQLQKAGMNAKMNQVDQSSLVNDLLGGNFSVTLVRNFYSDPAYGDASNYIWFSKGPVNFSKFDDPTVQATLDTGRTATDDEARRRPTRTSTGPWRRRSTTCRPGTPSGPWSPRA